MLPSVLTNTTEQYIVYVHWNEAHFTYLVHLCISYQCTLCQQHLRKRRKPSPNCIFTYMFVLFLFRSGATPMTLLNAGMLTDPQLPATASNACTTDARLGGIGRVPPPDKNPDHAGAPISYVLQTLCVGIYIYQID